MLFKEAISGSWNANAAMSAGILLAYLAGFLLLSIFFSRKAIRSDVKQTASALKERLAIG